MAAHINDEMLNKMDAYWRAANYLAAGQLYLLDNPLLKEPLKPEHIKKKIVGHWGTVPGQNLIYVHLNRIIKQYNLDMILLSGPGHGGNFFVANTYLEGTYSEVYPNISEDTEGMKRLFKQFSFPGGIASHVAPETPGSIHITVESLARCGWNNETSALLTSDNVSHFLKLLRISKGASAKLYYFFHNPCAPRKTFSPFYEKIRLFASFFSLSIRITRKSSPSTLK